MTIDTPPADILQLASFRAWDKKYLNEAKET